MQPKKESSENDEQVRQNEKHSKQDTNKLNKSVPIPSMPIETAMFINKGLPFQRITILWRKYSNILDILHRKYYNTGKHNKTKLLYRG